MLSMGENSSCRALNVLWLLYRIYRETNKVGVTVVNTGHNEGMNQGLCIVIGQEQTKTSL